MPITVDGDQIRLSERLTSAIGRRGSDNVEESFLDRQVGGPFRLNTSCCGLQSEAVLGQLAMEYQHQVDLWSGQESSFKGWEGPGREILAK